MLYRILLFSVKPQHESAISIHISPPFSVLAVYSFPGPLAMKKAVFFFEPFWSVSIGVFGLPASPVPSLGYIYGKKKTQGTHCCVVTQVLKSLVGLPSSLYLSESSHLMLVLHIMFRIFNFLGRIEEKYILSIFLEVEVQIYCFKTFYLGLMEEALCFTSKQDYLSRTHIGIVWWPIFNFGQNMLELSLQLSCLCYFPVCV